MRRCRDQAQAHGCPHILPTCVQAHRPQDETAHVQPEHWRCWGGGGALCSWLRCTGQGGHCLQLTLPKASRVCRAGYSKVPENSSGRAQERHEPAAPTGSGKAAEV